MPPLPIARSVFTPSASVDVAVEIAYRRLSVAQISGTSGRLAVSAFASETIPDDAVVPGLAQGNIPNQAVVVAALRRAFEKAGVKPPKRVALVVPDSIARVSLLPFEQVPARAADLDQLVRWQLRKAVAFPIEEAQVSHAVAHVEAGVTRTMTAVLARRDVIAEYEGVANALGMHAGVVDLASFNVANTVLATGTEPAGDWLLVHLTPESTTLAIFRGRSLVFYRNRAATDAEPLSTLVHQTAMYHVDRLAGTTFSRVWLCGAGSDAIAAGRAKRELADRLGITAESVDPRTAAALRDRVTPNPDVLDALAAPLGILIRDRKAA